MSEIQRNTAAEQRAWLRKVLSDTGLAPTTLAKQVKLAPSTLTRFLDEAEAGARTLHATTIAKIAAATGIAPPQQDMPEPSRRPVRGYRDDGEPFRGEPADKELAGVIRALQGRRNAVDPWTLKTRALEDIGYLPGDVVIVDIVKTAAAGDVVRAEVFDYKGIKAETVFRLYEPPYLVAASRDPALRKPIMVDGERVTIKGVVTDLWRPNKAA